MFIQHFEAWFWKYRNVNFILRIMPTDTWTWDYENSNDQKTSHVQNLSDLFLVPHSLQIITEREIDITIKVEGKEPVTTKFTNTNTVRGVVNKITTLGLVDNTQTPTIFVSTFIKQSLNNIDAYYLIQFRYCCVS